jgi:hypothetical protein
VPAHRLSKPYTFATPTLHPTGANTAAGSNGDIVVSIRDNHRQKRSPRSFLAAALLVISPVALLSEATAQTSPQPPTPPASAATHVPVTRTKEQTSMSDEMRSPTGETEMKAAKALTTKVLAIGSWTAKATPETRPAIMPSEARDTLRLMLRGKIDQWFAKSDGSGAVFLMNVTDTTEAHALLEALPLGKAGMMTFELIPVGPLWPLGLMLREPAK